MAMWSTLSIFRRVISSADADWDDRTADTSTDKDVKRQYRCGLEKKGSDVGPSAVAVSLSSAPTAAVKQFPASKDDQCSNRSHHNT
jgi:hypothetical protein